MNFIATKEPEYRTLVDVEGVWFYRNEHLILKDINLKIKKGDFLAIIGPNGAGKTTLLKLILGLLRPNKGSIKIMGIERDKFSQNHLIGYVPQKATHTDTLFPICAKEVVALGLLSAKKFPRWLSYKDREKIDMALDKVGMIEFKNIRLSHLSGGQQQRIFIARAIVNNPKILFLDEPTAGIDALAQEEFYDMLKQLHNQGITVVMVTHDVGVVNKYVNKVACLNQKLVFHGTHEEFCSSPKALKLIPGDHHLVIHRH